MTREQELSFSILCSQNGWHKARIQEARDEIRNLIEQQANEIDALRGFAQAVMKVWPETAMDGGDLQDVAVDHGLLRLETRTERCGERCYCEVNSPVWVCYRKTELLTGK